MSSMMNRDSSPGYRLPNFAMISKRFPFGSIQKNIVLFPDKRPLEVGLIPE